MAESFHKQLILNRWLLSFFHDEGFQGLKANLNRPELEGFDPITGHSLYFTALQSWLLNRQMLPETDLARYDLNIVKHWQTITEERNRLEDCILQMKYFQYLALLFTEIYLDWYFNRKDSMLNQLNQVMAVYNANEKDAEQFQPYIADDLNKIAYWCATGSGKTLLLHVNVLQFLCYADKKSLPDKIILLTPNEGLTRQHIHEAKLSGFYAEAFTGTQNGTKQGDFSALDRISIDVIDINKLGEEKGEKVHAIDAFEGKNLVLIDEGHRGTSSGAGVWLARREAIARDGFSFEYSATFGQAVSKSKNLKKIIQDATNKKIKTLYGRNLNQISAEEKAVITLNEEELSALRVESVKELYAKCIIFDYSYKYFYADGYGKESLILNLAEDKKDEIRHRYLIACLLAFYQQQWLWQTKPELMKGFNIEKPLWVFVGNTVNDEDSDVFEILRFFGNFLNDRDNSVAIIDELLHDRAQLLDSKSRNIFHQRFLPLNGCKADSVFSGILKTLFNSDDLQRLKVVHLKGSTGELALRLGEHEPFGLINIGEAAKFAGECEDQSEFDLETDDFGKSLFHAINDRDSKLNILIGSRKFTEGWSSWRVSTMGLMNMGRGEGTQIIQLFGRGVRLKGVDYSLKRSRSSERPVGSHLQLLETLNIFGIRADYMAQFKAYLQEEGITPSDEMLQIEFATKQIKPATRLKTLKIKDGYGANQKHGFKRKKYPNLFEIPKELASKIKLPHVVLDLYPRLQTFMTGKAGSSYSTEDRNTGQLGLQHLAFINYDRIYLHLLDLKTQKTWFNMRIDKTRLIEFCNDTENNDWYTLYIPANDLQIHSFADYEKFEDILLQLLESYMTAFYERLRAAYEEDFFETVYLDESRAGFIDSYHFEIDNTEAGKEYEKRIAALKKLVENNKIGEISLWDCNHIKAICFDKHIYYPLMHLVDKQKVPLKMRPLAFESDSEYRFVKDLEAFYNSPQGKQFFKGKDLYLLRNADTRNRGIGFVRAGNFYPDFLLWIIDGEKQYLSFIDPKGIRNLNLHDPKLELFRTIKEYEPKIGDQNLVLNAFILSATKFKDILNNPFKSATELENRHLLFLDDGPANYLPKMFSRILAQSQQ